MYYNNILDYGMRIKQIINLERKGGQWQTVEEVDTELCWMLKREPESEYYPVRTHTCTYQAGLPNLAGFQTLSPVPPASNAILVKLTINSNV